VTHTLVRVKHKRPRSASSVMRATGTAGATGPVHDEGTLTQGTGQS